MTRRIIILLLTLALGLPAVAQETTPESADTTGRNHSIRLIPIPDPLAPPTEVLSLRECLRLGLERNYDIRIVRNEERISDNNATAANAGKLPTIDLSAGYGSNVNRIHTSPRTGEATTDRGVYDGTFDAGVALN